MKKIFRPLFALAFSTIMLSNAHADLNILSSIRPIAFLVDGVNQGINNQDLLVNGSISPHDYQPKPSDIQKIQDADIIFRIDDDFQPRFTRLFKAATKDKPIIALADIDTMQLVANEAHLEEEHDEEHEEEHDEDDAEDEDHGHQHSDSNFDLHIWLSPNNAIKITNEIALQLSKLDPKNREKYQYNAEQQNLHLRALDKRLHQQLTAYKNIDFFSYHDAYGYFTGSFGLNHSISLTPLSHQISANKVREIIHIAAEKNVKCIMLEPQLSNKLAITIAKTKSDINIETWDPLGFDLDIKAQSYQTLLLSMSNNLTKCLKNP